MMLDGVNDYLPSPLDVKPYKATNPDTNEEVDLIADDSAPFAGLAFKIATDPFVGRLTFFRVYTGTLEAGSYVLNASKGKRERVGRLLQMHSNHRNPRSILWWYRCRYRVEEHYNWWLINWSKEPIDSWIYGIPRTSYPSFCWT